MSLGAWRCGVPMDLRAVRRFDLDLRWIYMKDKISAPTIKNLKAGEKPYELVDNDLNGFLARVQPSPSKVISYYFAYRNNDGIKRGY
jgi:hypothetical protein